MVKTKINVPQNTLRRIWL